MAVLFHLLADFIVLVHVGFVVFVVFGGLLIRRWPKLIWVHLPAVAWGIAVEFAGWICPLTPLEDLVRQQAGMVAYRGDFIEHYLLFVLYPAGLTRGAQFLLGSTALVVNALMYWQLFRDSAEDH
jgi:hypothetical protein